MSYKFRYAFVLLIPALMIMSCGEKDFGLGKELIESRVRSIKIDTCSVSLSTLMLDSMTTSGLNKLIAGRIYSDEFGDISVNSYISFSLPSFSDNRSNSAIPLQFDSICLELQYDTYYTGDTISEHSLAIYELLEVLTLPDDGYFYSTSESLYSINTLAEKSFNPHLSKEENLRIRLPDYLGIDILTKISSGSDEFATQDKFNQYFRGFVITPFINFTIKQHLLIPPFCKAEL